MTLRELATTALAEHGDVDVAADAVLATVVADSTLYRELTEPLLKTVIRQEVQAAVRSERTVLWNGPREDTVRGLTLRAERELMAWKLRGGLLLADASGNDLLDNATFYEAQARTELVRAKWLRLIRAELSGPTAKVKDELREADLRRLQKKALKECGDGHMSPAHQNAPAVAAAV